MLDWKRAGRKGVLVLAILLLLSPLSQLQANPRHASIVIDADTGKVLHETNPDASRYPASLTKMMTLYMLFEAMEQRKMTLDSRMQVSARAASMPPTNIRLRPGDTISVREAIPALIVRSANDVAAVVAEALGGTEANFGRMMTDKARKLGMRATIFRNASGLPNDEQRTTARDMVTLSLRLMKDFPQYYHYFSTQSFRYRGITYHSHNRMVRNIQGVDGLKTGYIRTSGFNIATSAKRDNHRIIGVVMGGQSAVSRDQHMAQLLDRCFSRAPAAKLASNTSHDNARPAAAMKVSTAAPVPKPASSLEKMPDLSVLQPAAQPAASVAPQGITAADNNNWGVQLGSYLARDRAKAQAQAATRWIPGEAVVSEVKISNRKLYRAQLLGLQEDQARTACQSLARQKIECIVVRPHG